jgi:multicomponent Na+:H+ antiporter subunit D
MSSGVWANLTGAAGVVIGSLQAIGARSLMRLGAYAIAAQAGCALIGAALGSTAGFAAALLQLTAMAAAALALFGGAAAMSAAPSLNALDGLGRRAPLAGAAMTIAALSLMGAPLTIGFLSRWRLMEAAVHGGWQWASAAAVLTSLAGVLYGGQIIVRIYFRRSNTPTPLAGALTHWLLAPTLAAAMIVILWGINPTLVLAMSEQGALWRPGQFP